MPICDWCRVAQVDDNRWVTFLSEHVCEACEALEASVAEAEDEYERQLTALEPPTCEC